MRAADRWRLRECGEHCLTDGGQARLRGWSEDSFFPPFAWLRRDARFSAPYLPALRRCRVELSTPPVLILFRSSCGRREFGRAVCGEGGGAHELVWGATI